VCQVLAKHNLGKSFVESLSTDGSHRMQLAVSVQIPKSFDGAGGQCIYIDTEGSFVVERVAEMANALIAHLKAVADSNDDPTQKEDISSFSLQHILSRIHYFRVQDYVQQIAIVNALPHFLEQFSDVRLVIVDR